LKPKENNPAAGSSQPGSTQANRRKLEVKAVMKHQHLRQPSDDLIDYALEMQIFINNLRVASRLPRHHTGAKK
jgi:hypothetical protein